MPLTGFYTPGKTVVAIGVETALATPCPTDGRGSNLVPTAGTYHEIYVENLSYDQSREFLGRNGSSGHSQGFVGVHGAYDYDVSFDVETYGLAVSAATSHPTDYAILRTFMDAPTDTGSLDPLFLQNWLSTSNDFKPITVKIWEMGQAAATQDDLLQTYVSCLIDPTIKYPKNERVMTNCKVVPLTHIAPAGDDDSAKLSALTYKDTEGDQRLPIVNQGTTFTLVQNSVAATAYAGEFIEGEMAMNLNLTKVNVASGTNNGAIRVYPDTSENPSGTLRIVADDIATFDIFALRDAAIPFKFQLTFVPVDGNVMVDTWYLQIKNVKQGKEGAMKTWDLEVQAVYPGTSNDAGIQPQSGMFTRQFRSAAS